MSKVITDENKIAELLSRRIENVFPSREEAMRRFTEGKPLRVYFGIDPTGPEIHLGHTIPLLFLKQLARLGHKAILLIGDFTARIGDPTDKESIRSELSEKEVKNNMKTYLEQVYKILSRGTFEVEYNSRWLTKMNLEKLLKLGSKVTVSRMMERDMFQERIKHKKEISVNEFIYPLMQGYDSVAMEVDGEVGGNDQTFNMMIGRKLEKRLLNKEKLVFATRLLVDAASGKKMSKSEGEFIAINDSPKDIFEKVSNSIPDEMLKTVFELCTEVSLDDVDWSKNPVKLKEDLAFELVRMYHGEKEAEKVKEDWRKEDEFEVENGAMPLGLFIKGWKNISASQAKDLVSQGAVRVNDKIVKDWNQEVKTGDLVKAGKNRPVKAV